MTDQLLSIYDTLLDSYGPQRWWPANSPWEVCVGAVLTQNTNWKNVTKAIDNLKDADSLNVDSILSLETDVLEALLRPAGYFRLKTLRLRAMAKWWVDNTNDSCLWPENINMNDWRDSLLNVYGVGPETADSVLLYAFDQPSFVVDAYTKRMMERHFSVPPKVTYQVYRDFFMRNLPEDATLFNEFHALIVKLAVTHSGPKSCDQRCPLCALTPFEINILK